jgi:prepilin-type processing-associated H-X9-DG protein
MIELLIVIAIITTLIGLLLPAIQSIREMARRTQCVNNLLQLGVALSNYASTHRVLPPGVVNGTGPILSLPQGYHYSWAVQILPFLERGSVFRGFDFAHGVYEAANASARDCRLSSFLCPSDFTGQMNYAGCHHDVETPIDADNHGVLYLNSHVAHDEITDGLAYTILLGEVRSGASLGWASGTRATLRNTGSRINAPDPTVPGSFGGPLPNSRARPQGTGLDDLAAMIEQGVVPIDFVGGFASQHVHGANFLFCDGSVHRLDRSIDEGVYRRLGNRADGEIIDADDY